MAPKLKIRLPEHSKTQIWNKFFDLLIVIVGITIAFQLNNLKQRNDQQTLERFYLESIIVDLDKDIETYEKILFQLEEDRKLAGFALDKLKQSEKLTDTLGFVLANILSLNTFTPKNSTYSTLLGGNGLTAIRNRDIRNLISEHYNLYTSIYRFESVYTQFLFRLFDYFSPYCNYTTRKIIDATVTGKVETLNMLLIAREQLNDGISSYTRSLEKAGALKESIATLLN
jgi:hypothetical protein